MIEGYIMNDHIKRLSQAVSHLGIQVSLVLCEDRLVPAEAAATEGRAVYASISRG